MDRVAGGEVDAGDSGEGDAGVWGEGDSGDGSTVTVTLGADRKVAWAVV